MQQTSYLEALRQIERAKPGGVLWQESQQAIDEWERTEVHEVISELERDFIHYPTDEDDYQVIVEWDDEVAYLIPMTREGCRKTLEDLPDRVRWEERS